MNITTRLYASITYRTTYYLNKFKDTLIKVTIQAPVIKTIDETIDEIITNKCSVSRYGSGEVEIILGYNIGFQSANLQLADKLKQILISTDPDIIICLPDIFHSLENCNGSAQSYWSRYLFSTRWTWYKLTSREKVYYNAFITRLYLDWKDKTKCEGWFNKLKQIWHERDVVIVEGYQSRLGLGNDLFDNAQSIVRIVAPPENAFSKYEEIFNAVIKQEKTKIILLALGPTATVLAYDLHKEGYQAVDIGHIDVEYEWFLRKATSKMKIPYKYVNEVEGGRKVEDVVDQKYVEQIIAVI